METKHWNSGPFHCNLLPKPTTSIVLHSVSVPMASILFLRMIKHKSCIDVILMPLQSNANNSNVMPCHVSLNMNK